MELWWASTRVAPTRWWEKRLPAEQCRDGIPIGRGAREVSFGEERSRVDWLLEPPNDKPWYVEVKNVTAAVDGGIAAFPDAVTTRGTRHLRELTRLVSSGVANAALVFCVQRSDVVKVRPAHEIDPDYAAALKVADEAGVRVLALRARISQEQSFLDTAIDVLV